MLVKFGKSVDALMAIKAGTLSENDAIQGRLDEIAAEYARQPRRVCCKNCALPIAGESFRKRGIGYAICERCGHLSGLHEDTDQFCEMVYTSNDGGDYAAAYLEGAADAYRGRVDAIYRPKAEFLFDGIRAAGDDPARLRFADFGAGSGYFVAALTGMAASVRGFEVSQAQIELAGRMNPGIEMHAHRLEETEEIARTVDAQVVSFVGVLEHLQKPREAIAALAKNSAVRYVYLSLPLFSPCVAIEAVFPEVMQRHLAGGHTHLYTEQSINWLADEFGFSPIAQWWFGTDMMDFYRSVSVMLGKSGESEGLVDLWNGTMAGALDELQLALDRRKFSSEVHVLLRKA